MAFFLVKAADELIEGDISGALSTITSGLTGAVPSVAPIVQTLDTDAANALNAFMAYFGASATTTLLTGLQTTLQSGIKAGLTTTGAGIVTDAEGAAQAAAKAV